MCRGPPGAGLGEAEFVRRRQVELVRRGCWPGEVPVEGRVAQGRGARGRARRRRRGLLVVGQAAGFRAVGGTVGLLVATQAELVFPVERHGGWWSGREVELEQRGVDVVRPQTAVERADTTGEVGVSARVCVVVLLCVVVGGDLVPWSAGLVLCCVGGRVWS